MQKVSRGLMAAIIGALGAGVEHSGVPMDVQRDLSRNPYHALNFKPHGGYEHVLGRRGGNTMNAKPARARRLNQCDAKSRQRFGI